MNNMSEENKNNKERAEKNEEELQRSSEEVDEAELVLVNNSLAFESINPDNIKDFFTVFQKILPLLAQRISPEKALLDPMAQAHAYAQEHQVTDLYEERVYSNHLSLEVLKWMFPETPFPVIKPGQSNEEIQNQLGSYFYSLGDWLQLWQVFKELLRITFPEEQFIVEYFEAMEQFFARDWVNFLTLEERYRHDELYALLFKNKETLEPSEKNKLWEEYEAIEKKIEAPRRKWEKDAKKSLRKFQKHFLSLKEKEHGRTFENPTEQRLYESSLRLQKELPYLISLRTRRTREELARGANTKVFCYSVLNSIKQPHPITLEAHQILQLFNEILNDFISFDPEGLWPFNENLNFLHDIFHYPDAQTILSPNTSTKYFADMAIDELENLLEDLQAIFQKYSVLNKKQTSLHKTVQRHCLHELIVMFLADVPYNYAYGNEQQKLAFNFSFKGYGYTEDSPIVLEIKKRYRKLKDFSYRDKGYRDSHIQMLRSIHLFPFTVVRKIYEGENISRQIYDASKKYYKKLYKKLLLTVDSAIHSQIEAFLQPLKNLVKGLIEQRTKNGEFSEVLGLGFSGPLFEQINFANSKENIVYLAFSRTGCTPAHYYLLTLLRSRLYQLKFIRKNMEISIFGKAGEVFTSKNEEHIKDLIDIQSDHQAYTYILQRILKRTLSADADIHSNLKEIWLKIILEIIADAKKDDLSNSEKKRLTNCVKSTQLPAEDYEKIRELVLKDQHYGCAEALISKYGSTNKYIPIIFLPQHKDQAQLNGAPVYAGSLPGRQRLVIAPCYRCRLLSAPYLLWSILYKGWGLGDLNLIAKRQGKQPIQPRFFPPNLSSKQLAISKPTGQNGTFDVLPEDIKLEIFKYFKPVEQMELSRVSKSWSYTLSSPTLWSHNWCSLFSQPDYIKQKDLGNYRRRFFIIKNRLEIIVDKVSQLLHSESAKKKNYFESRETILKGFEVLIKDIKVNFCEFLYQFLKKYPDVNQLYNRGYSLLHIAVALGEFEAVRYLITEQGANINLPDCKGYKPLAIAIELCPSLSKEGPGKQNSRMVSENFKKIIKFLILNGADTNNMNIYAEEEEEENTAIGQAQLSHSETLAEIIRAAISERSNIGMTLGK